MRRPPLPPLAALVLSLALAGCSADDAPGAPSGTASSSVTPSPCATTARPAPPEHAPAATSDDVVPLVTTPGAAPTTLDAALAVAAEEGTDLVPTDLALRWDDGGEARSTTSAALVAGDCTLVVADVPAVDGDAITASTTIRLVSAEGSTTVARTTSEDGAHRQHFGGSRAGDALAWLETASVQILPDDVRVVSVPAGGEAEVVPDDDAVDGRTAAPSPYQATSRSAARVVWDADLDGTPAVLGAPDAAPGEVEVLAEGSWLHAGSADEVAALGVRGATWTVVVLGDDGTRSDALVLEPPPGAGASGGGGTEDTTSAGTGAAGTDSVGTDSAGTAPAEADGEEAGAVEAVGLALSPDVVAVLVGSGERRQVVALDRASGDVTVVEAPGATSLDADGRTVLWTSLDGVLWHTLGSSSVLHADVDASLGAAADGGLLAWSGETGEGLGLSTARYAETS